MRDTTAQSRFESVSKHSNDSLLAREVFIAEREVVSTATITETITTEEITLAQVLEASKTSKPKVKGIVFQEPSKSTTTTTISSQQSQDNGKGIMIEEPVNPKKKDQIRLDEEAVKRLQARLQAQEQEELSDAEKATLFQQLLEKRRKHFAAKKAKEKRNKPPTQAHKRKIMCNYLKNMEGYKLKDLKLKEFDKIKEMFDRAFRRKIHKEGKKSYYQIVRSHGKSQMYMFFSQMLKSFDREDLEDLYKLVKARYESTRPVENMDYLLWSDMKLMFKPHVEDEVWKRQQRYKVLEWKLYDSCGLHSLMMQSMQIYMLVEKKYPLTPPTFSIMLEKKLQIDYESEKAYQLSQVCANAAQLELVLLMNFIEKYTKCLLLLCEKVKIENGLGRVDVTVRELRERMGFEGVKRDKGGSGGKALNAYNPRNLGRGGSMQTVVDKGMIWQQTHPLHFMATTMHLIKIRKVVKSSSKLFKSLDQTFNFLPLILSSSNTNPTHPPPTTTPSQPPPPSHPPAATIQDVDKPHLSTDHNHTSRRLYHLSCHKSVNWSSDFVSKAEQFPVVGDADGEVGLELYDPVKNYLSPRPKFLSSKKESVERVEDVIAKEGEVDDDERVENVIAKQGISAASRLPSKGVRTTESALLLFYYFNDYKPRNVHLDMVLTKETNRTPADCTSLRISKARTSLILSWRVSEAVVMLVLPLCSLTQLSFVCQPKDSGPDQYTTCQIVLRFCSSGTTLVTPDLICPLTHQLLRGPLGVNKVITFEVLCWSLQIEPTITIFKRAITDYMSWRHPDSVITDPRHPASSYSQADVWRPEDLMLKKEIKLLHPKWFLVQSVGSSNAGASDSPYLLVLITETSQSRQHGSHKSPIAVLFDIDTGRISIRHCEMLKSTTLNVLARS
nr:hypothetical protein [Tanacetum cinerariifolium]